MLSALCQWEASSLPASSSPKGNESQWEGLFVVGQGTLSHLVQSAKGRTWLEELALF